MPHGAGNTAPRRVPIRVPALLLCILAALPGCSSRDTGLPDVPAPPDTSVQADAMPTPVRPGARDAAGTTAADGTRDYGASQDGPVQTAGPEIQASGRQQAGTEYADLGTDTDARPDGQDDVPSDGGAVLLGDIGGLPDGACSGGAEGLGLDPWSGAAYAEANCGRPYFDIPRDPYETAIFSALDDYKRPGSAYACTAGTDGRPVQDPGWKDVPAGWQGAAYPDLVPGGPLYHKARLIGAGLYTGKKDIRNMAAVTQYCEENGLGPVEAELSAHIAEFGGYLAVRVTPVYTGTNLLCDGVLVEAASIGGNTDDTDDDPDNDSLSMCVFCYNVQPGVEIDYRDGSSSASGDGGWSGTDGYGNHDYILDESGRTFHEGPCAAVAGMRDSQRREYRGPRSVLVENRYEPCGLCRP